MSRSTIGQARKTFREKPCLTDRFTLSNDSMFAEPADDIVGLRLDRRESDTLLTQCALRLVAVAERPPADRLTHLRV